MLINEVQKVRQWRSMISFWILGFCNNVGFVAMLAVAKDIIEIDNASIEINAVTNSSTNARDCNDLSTGTILIADIFPSLIIKLFMLFLPYHKNYRISSMIILSIIGYLLVGLSTSVASAILGVVIMSIGFGIGENTLLSYSSLYNDRDVLSMLSSGNGAAGLLGTFAISAMTTLGISSNTCMFIMISLPVSMIIIFWFILESPKQLQSDTNDVTLEQPPINNVNTESKSNDEPITNDKQCKKILSGLKTQFLALPFTFYYSLPLGVIYLLQYLVNQGLMELVEFDNIFLDHTAQYRWLQVAYRTGTFLSQTVAIPFNYRFIWIFALLQVVNSILFTTETIYFFTPTIWLVLGLACWEGLVGGSSYITTFSEINTKVPSDKKQFTMEAASFFITMGVTISGFLAMPIHNTLCLLPKPNRKSIL